MRKPASVHIDIAEFVMTIVEVPESERGDWLMSLAKCLSYANPSLNEYGAKLLGEVEQYRESERIRKEKYKEADARADKTRKDKERQGKTVFPESDNKVSKTEQTEQTEQNKKNKTKEARPKGLLDVYIQFVSLGLLPNKAEQKAEEFMSHYNANGWKVGGNAMKDWKSACSGTWMKNETRLTGYDKIHIKLIHEKLIEFYEGKSEIDPTDILALKRDCPQLFVDPMCFNDEWIKFLGLEAI